MYCTSIYLWLSWWHGFICTEDTWKTWMHGCMDLLVFRAHPINLCYRACVCVSFAKVKAMFVPVYCVPWRSHFRRFAFCQISIKVDVCITLLNFLELTLVGKCLCVRTVWPSAYPHSQYYFKLSTMEISHVGYYIKYFQPAVWFVTCLYNMHDILINTCNVDSLQGLTHSRDGPPLRFKFKFV